MSDSNKGSSEVSARFGAGVPLAPNTGDSMPRASSNQNHKPPGTPAVDLFNRGDRFASASRIFSWLHRWQLLLRKYGWTLALIIVVMVGSACVLTFRSAPVYESKARMWLAGKLDISEGRLYTEELLDYLGTQAELLRSRVIQKRALARIGAKFTQFAAFARVESGANAETTDGADNSVSPGDRANPKAPFKVKVIEGSRSSILELRAFGPDAAVTRAYLTSLMEEYVAFKREVREKSSDRTLASATAQVEQLARELEAQQEKLHAFQSSNNVVFLQEQGNSAGSYLATLSKQLATMRNELRLLQMLQPEQWVERETGPKTAAQGNASPPESIAKDMAASLAGPQLELFKVTQQIQVLKAKRDDLSRFLRPLHPKIIKLNEDIATQEKLAQTVRDEAMKQMNHRRHTIEMEIQNLETASVEWDAKAIEASRKMADYDRMRQDLQRIQAAYEKMLGLIQKVDLNKNVEQENIGILEPASAAEPRRPIMRNLGLAVIASFLLGFGLLYCLGMMRDDFSSLNELSDHLSEEVVGKIPAISMPKPKGRLAVEGLQKQRFDFLESFRNLRSSLLFMNNGGPKPKTIVIASSVPEEGKSTVSLYLAATIAMGNSRVLLIDADMRRGSLHELFGAHRTPGLAEVLDHEIAASNAIVSTGFDNLMFLPAGKAKRNPGELALSSEWRSLITEAERQFDYVVVDTPPVLAADDVSTLASRTDGVLFVVRGSFTSARMARTALDALRQRHINVLGLVFNRAMSSRYEGGYYGKYEGAYGWREQTT